MGFRLWFRSGRREDAPPETPDDREPAEDVTSAGESTSQLLYRLQAGLEAVLQERADLDERGRDLRRDLGRMEGVVQRVVDAGLLTEARSILVELDGVLAEMEELQRRRVAVVKLQHDLSAARRWALAGSDEQLPEAPEVEWTPAVLASPADARQ